MVRRVFIAVLALLVVAILVVAVLLLKPWEWFGGAGGPQVAVEDTMPQEEDEADGTVRTARIELPGGTDGGKGWMVSVVPEDGLMLVDSGVEDGVYRWVFRSAAEGEVDLEFVYGAGFEDEAPEQVVSYRFSVGADGELVFLSAGGTLPEMLLPQMGGADWTTEEEEGAA